MLSQVTAVAMKLRNQFEVIIMIYKELFIVGTRPSKGKQAGLDIFLLQTAFRPAVSLKSVPEVRLFQTVAA